MARIALIGSNGQLGSDIIQAWPDSTFAQRGDELIPLTHAEIEVTDEEMVRSVLSGIQPGIVINTSGFLRVDDCESRPLAALEVNTLGVKFLAETSRDLGATLVHFSTDYVFDGASKTPYREESPTNPVNAYGISKVAGESFLRYLLPDSHILVRSSGLYGVAGASGKGGNFIETILRLARDGQPLRIVDDQVSAPTYTTDLAQTLLQVIDKGGRGTFHITNAGQCSWYDFARTVFGLLGKQPDLAPTTSEAYAAPAKRPAFSVLGNARLKQMGLSQPRPWQEALEAYLRSKGHLPQ